MLKRHIAILIAGGLLSAQVNLAAGQASSAVNADDQYWKPLPSQLKYLEERAATIQKEARGDVYKTIKVEASTKDVTVDHFATVKIANDKGQSFVWTFDTLGEAVIPLKTIAPAGFAAGDITIYVRHPAAHIPG